MATPRKVPLPLRVEPSSPEVSPNTRGWMQEVRAILTALKTAQGTAVAATIDNSALSSIKAQLMALLERVEALENGSGGDPVEVTLTFSATAGELLEPSAPLVMASDGKVYNASNAVSGHVLAFVGFAQAGADADAAVDVIFTGEVTDEDWAWTPGAALYISAAGNLSNVPGSGNYQRRVGVALTATSLRMEDGEPIILGTGADTIFLGMTSGVLTRRQAISLRAGANAGIVASKADGVLHPSLSLASISVMDEDMYIPEGGNLLYSETVGLSGEGDLTGPGDLLVLGSPNTLPPNYGPAGYSPMTDHGALGGSHTFRASDGMYQAGLLTAGLAITLVDVPAASSVNHMVLILEQGGLGSNTITWPPECVADGGGSIPPGSTTVGYADIWVLTKVSGSSNWAVQLAFKGLP